MESFSLQDSVWRKLIASHGLLDLLQVTDPLDDDQLNTRIKREEFPVELLTTDVLPFISIVFINAHVTRNYLKNNGIFELNIYCSTRNDANNIYGETKKIMQNNYEDFQVYAEGQVSSGIVGVYQYRARFKPLINS